MDNSRFGMSPIGTLFRTIPQAGDYDIAFSPDGKMIAGTGNGYVSILWAEDGTRAARLPGPTGWMHPVDFSHDSDTRCCWC